MKRSVRVLSLLLAVVLLCGLLAGCADTARPLNYFKKALENTLEHHLGAYAEVVKAALAGGSIEAKLGQTDLVDMPLDAGEIKVYFDRDGKRLTALGFATVEGTKYDSQIYLTDGELAFASEAFLGADRFGMKFSELKEQVPQSPFYNASGSSLKKDWINDSFADNVRTVKSDLLEIYVSMEQLLSLSDEITEIFLDALTGETPHRIEVTGGKAKITATVTNVTLSRALKVTRGAVVSNGRLCNELRRYAALRDSLVTVQTGTESKEWLTFVNNFIDTPNSINEICAKIDNELTAFELELAATVDHFSTMIDLMTVELKLDSVQRFSFTADLREGLLLSLTYDGFVRTFTYRVTKDGWQHYDAELAYTKTDGAGNSLIHMTGAVNADYYADTFTLTLDQEGDHRVYNGYFDKKPYNFWFSVDGVTVNGVQHPCSMTLSVEAEDAAPAMIDYDPLFTVEPTRYKTVDERVQRTKTALREAWGDTPVDLKATAAFLLNVTGLEEEIPYLPEKETE